MIEKGFLQILNMSITASYVILFVMVARLLLKKAPKIFSYLMWFVVLFRLISPFSFESVASLIPASTETVPQSMVTGEALDISSGISTIDVIVKNSMMSSTIAEANITPLQGWISIGAFIWLMGIFILFLYSVTSTLQLRKKLKRSTSLTDNIFLLEGIETPFVFGVIAPKIYLPTGLDLNERSYIVKHEETHIKRCDHIIKPLAFILLCLHWFNPLVWIAFFLMSEDMELSCDESVIKSMGNGIKKEYSTSLLALSTNRRIIGGCPLAFGENNTKSRIKNILNYKKPGFWVVGITVIAVALISFGLISNPLKQLTVEDYANMHIKAAIHWHELYYKILDSKITKLERLASFDGMLPYPIEVWSLEYRLKPDDISKVMMAGGMNVEDGWITEDNSMGKPLMVISYKGKRPIHLGNIQNSEWDYHSVAGQETALRRFLENHKLIAPVTFKGNHVLVKFPLSSGDTAQLLLSQPVVQGDLGIWCVERWKDTNGNLYYVTPLTDGSTEDYYMDLQRQWEGGHRTSLSDPIQVAMEFIHNELGQRRVSLNDLVVQLQAKVEDFIETPESHFIGYISNFEKDSTYFHLDRIEWLTLNDIERLEQLNIDPNELTNGYYIYNPESYPMYCGLTEDTQYYIIDWVDFDNFRIVTKEEFVTYLERYKGLAPPFRIITKNGYVQSITEQYIP